MAANTNKKGSQKKEKKMTIAETREALAKAEAELEHFKDLAWCNMCGVFRKKEQFYTDTDPKNHTHVSRICKKCAYSIAMRQDQNGDYHEPTKESIQEALFYLNKPFINSVFESSIQESDNEVTGKTKNNVWTAYIKNIAMINYIGLTWRDSDIFKEKIVYDDEKEEQDRKELAVNDEYLKNKRDVNRLLGYDPFESEALSDQPYLYSQLIGLMDTGGDENDDMMRNSSCITIVRGFLQAEKIDNAVVGLMRDSSNIERNSATIKSLQDSKQKIMNMITNLAAENCISLKNNKNSKKGENTWTGKIKKIKDLNLRSGETNGFDIATCKGMRQVQEISDASIMKQLQLDDSEWSDMVAEMRAEIVNLRQDRDAYQEINRILLQENIDLKDYMDEHELLKPENIVDLKQLYSKFSSEEDEDTEIEREETDNESDNSSSND